jgi:hypothetical protein
MNRFARRRERIPELQQALPEYSPLAQLDQLPEDGNRRIACPPGQTRIAGSDIDRGARQNNSAHLGEKACRIDQRHPATLA